MTGDNHDRDEQLKEELGTAPTAEELDREQRAALREASGYIRHPHEPEIIFTGHVTLLRDFELEDLFSRYHPHLKEDRCIAHAVILWRDAKGNPLYLLKWWAPPALLTADELSQASYYDSDVDFRVIERGVAGGAARAREQFSMWEVENEGDRSLLGLSPHDLALHATREFYDQDGVCLCFERQTITEHWSFGHVRDLRGSKGRSTEW